MERSGLQAAVAIVIYNKKLLMVQLPLWYAPFPGYWTSPGGLVDSGQTPEQAVIREVKEETNIDISVSNHLETIHNVDGHEVYFYNCQYIGGEIVHQAEEIAQARWVELSQLDTLEIAYDNFKNYKNWGLI